MADSFFFINSETLSSEQTPAQAFGPVEGSEQTQFRVTSKFSTNTNVLAYAICTGQVFLQPNEDSAKVNLILRPYKQPIKGLAIKYFVYRGLKKTDFIPSGNEDIVSYGQKDSASGFIKLLWEQLKAFDEESVNSAFKAKWIGYDPENQPADTFIDDYFFMADAYGDDDNEALKPFEFPIVPAGTQLGNFTGDFGLDIVLSDGDYKSLSSNTGFNYDLKYARATESIINTAQVPSGYSEKQYREAILDFMDPAAFYGLHVTDGTVKINTGSGPVTLKGNQIYEQSISKFATKNKVYIHILGHLGRSYNYYESYNEVLENGDIIKLGISAEEISPIDYSNSWPLIIQEAEQSHSSDMNTLFIQLVYSNESKPILFGQVASMSSKAEKNFLTDAHLIPDITTVLEDEEFTPHTNAIELYVPAVSDSARKLNVATFVKLLYEATILEASDAATGIAQVVKPIDTLFGPINIEQRLASASDEVISWCFNSNYRLTDVSNVNYENESQIITQTKIIEDKIAYQDGENEQIQNRVVYETQSIAALGKSILNPGNSITSSESAGKVPYSKDYNNFYKPELPYFFETSVFSDFGKTITEVKLEIANSDVKNKFMLGVTFDENELLKNIINSTKGANASLYLEPFSNGENFESDGFSKYLLYILNEDSEGALRIQKPLENIIVYSVDNHMYFSSEYSKTINILFNPEEDIIPNFNL